MTANEILTGLTTRGVRLLANGDRLTIDAPASSLTDEERAAIRKHKAELLAILTEPGRCPVCHGQMNLNQAQEGRPVTKPTRPPVPTTANLDWTIFREEMRMISPEIFERHNFSNTERRYLLYLVDDFDRHTAWRYAQDSRDLYPMTSGWRERATHVEKRWRRERMAMLAEAAAQRRIALDKEMLAATGGTAE